MEHPVIKRQIESCMKLLHEQYETINNREGKIPQIEIDILLDNTRNLYEALVKLNKINNADVATPVVSHAEEIKPEIAAELKSQLNEPVPAEKTQEIPVDKKIIEERAKVISGSQKPPVKSGSLFEEAEVLADTFEKKETLHAKISKSKEEKSIADKFSALLLQDLKKSIGINEKFKFVNELFDGDLQEYNSSVDALNNCRSFSEAEEFIAQALIPKFGWQKESGVYQSLLFLVQRKFNF